jgi:ubiquilin
MADDAATEETPVTFNIKSSSDAKYILTLPLSLTVLELKNKLAGADYADIPPERQRLIYSGRVLKDPDTLASYKIKEGNTVHLVKGAASNQRQNPANASSSAANSGTTSTSSGVPTNLAAGTGNNPLAGLTGARYAGFAQLPGAGMFGPDGGVSPDVSHCFDIHAEASVLQLRWARLQTPSR